jgi:hypothetical protein
MRRHITLGTLSLTLLAASFATAQTQTAPPLPPATQAAQPADPKLPDAPSATDRLTPHQKFHKFVKRTYSPYTFASAAFGATWAQAWGDWYTYGGGMEGWGKRFGASLANTEGRLFFNSFLLPVVFHQDPRYFPSKKHGFGPRAWYAGTRVFVARSDDGDKMFNYSEVLGVLFMSSLQNSYYPREERGFPETFNRFAGGLGSDAATNVLKEFSPEIKRVVRKVIPKRAQKMEEKVEQKVEEKIPESVRKMGEPPTP